MFLKVYTFITNELSSNLLLFFSQMPIWFNIILEFDNRNKKICIYYKNVMSVIIVTTTSITIKTNANEDNS